MSDKVIFRLGWDASCCDVVAVKIIENEDVFVAASRGQKEGAGLIREDLAGHFEAVRIDVMSARWFDCCCIEHIVGSGEGTLYGSVILAFGIEVAFDGRFRNGRMSLQSS